MRFFSLEGKYPPVLRDDGKAFILDDDGTWGEISANELRAEPRNDEYTAAEFDTVLALFGGSLADLPKS
jgi:hypothetical protein